MRFGFNEVSLAHDPGPRHPESPDRLRALRQVLEETHHASFESPAPASREAVTAVHDSTYVEEIFELVERGGGRIDADTVANEGTWDAALASAGIGMWSASEAVVPESGRTIPFGLCRPPGHHAVRDEAMGFCFFNNAAVAADHVLATEGGEKVAIVDWDVHHGNGTQDIFYEREDVGYFSVHEAGLYPATGAIEETGTGEGEGTTVNVPLPSGAGDPGYAAVFREIVRPWLTRFDPDWLLISAGFDAHRHDPISRMALTTEGFGVLTKTVFELSKDLEIALGMLLEGGYNLDSLADGVEMVNAVCHGYEPVEPDETPRAEDRECITAVRERHGLGS